MTNPLIENIKTIPPVTRFFTISTVLACLGVTTFSAFPSLYINLNALFSDYTIVRAVFRHGLYFDIFKAVATGILGWYRFVTSFLIPPGIMSTNRINALFDAYFFYTFSNHLEAHEGKFKGNFPDYLLSCVGRVFKCSIWHWKLSPETTRQLLTSHMRIC